MREEVEEELEVLRAIYGDEQVQLLTEASAEEVRIGIDLQPRVERGAALVSVTIAVALPVGYPASTLPEVHVERSRGLGDVAVGSLVAAAQRACEEHGLQEVGCLSQVLDEISQALDLANDSQVECNICLASCSPGENAVHPPCDHIFHASCIGHWATLKADEKEAEALEAASSTFAARNGLRREVDESVIREEEASSCASTARSHAAMCAKLAEIVRLRRDGGERAENLEVDAELEAKLVNEEGEELPLDFLVEQARSAKVEEKRLIAEERRAQARLAEEQRRLEELEATLAQEAASRAVAPLPCPVCREPIERSLLPEPRQREAPKAGKTENVHARVAALPEELRSQVYRVQAQQRDVLERRMKREAELAELQMQVMQTTAPVAVQVALAHGSGEHKSAADEISGKGTSKGYGKSTEHSRSNGSTGTNEVVHAPSWNASNWDNNWSGSWWTESGDQSDGRWNSRNEGYVERGGKSGNRGNRWRK